MKTSSILLHAGVHRLSMGLKFSWIVFEFALVDLLAACNCSVVWCHQFIIILRRDSARSSNSHSSRDYHSIIIVTIFIFIDRHQEAVFGQIHRMVGIILAPYLPSTIFITLLIATRTAAIRPICWLNVTAILAEARETIIIFRHWKWNRWNVFILELFRCFRCGERHLADTHLGTSPLITLALHHTVFWTFIATI